MRNRLEALVLRLANRPGPPLLLCAVLAVACGLLALRVDVDPGNEALFLRSDPARHGQEILDARFGGDKLCVVALEGPVLTEPGLERLDDLTAAVEELDGISSVVSITTAKNVYQGPVEVYAWSPYEWLLDGERTGPDGEFEPYDASAFAAEVLAEPLFAGNLVGEGGRMAAVVVTIAPGADQDAVVEALRAEARTATGDGYHAHVAGFPVERLDFARLIAEDQQVFVPLVVLVIAIMTGLLFRQVWGVLLPLLCVGLTVLATMALAALLDIRLNAVTSLLTPVVMVVSVAVAVNICIAYTQERREHNPGATSIAAAYRRVGLACLFTTLTTVLGFAGLAISDVPAIRAFGGLCAFGVGFSYLAALLLLPALFGLEPGSPLLQRRLGFGRLFRLLTRTAPSGLVPRHGALEGGLGRLGPFVARRRVVILVGAALVLGGAAWGVVKRLRVDTDILAQLPPGSDLALATRAIDEGLGGVNAIELLFLGEPGGFRRLEPLQALSRVRGFLAEREGAGVRKAFDVTDILARLHEVKHGQRALPADQETLDYYFGILDRGGADTPVRLVLDEDASVARLSVRLRALPSSQVYALLQELQDYARGAMPAGIEVLPAGEYVLIQNMTHHLPRSQAKGLLVAGILILLSISVLFGSLRLGALAAIPASIPILFTYGLMGWLGIDLSTATSMIASVAIGLAVDATILLLARFQDERKAGAGRAAAIRRTLETAGQSVTYSNLTLVFGFSVGALSSFPPVRDFAVLTAGTIAFTYLGAVLLLPALLGIGRDEGEATGA